MKKLAYSIAILLAACACTKEEAIIDVNDAPAEALTFTATFGNDVDTKTTLGNGNTILWDKGDCISVFDCQTDGTSQNAKFTLVAGAGTTEATFSGNGQVSTSGYFAVYPYNSNYTYRPSGYTYGSVEMTPDLSVQYANKGSIPSNIPMIAIADAPTDGSKPSLSFKNVFSYLKVTTNYECQSITVTPKSSIVSLTPSKIGLCVDSGIPFVNYYSKNTTHTVTLKNKDGKCLTPGTYYIAIQANIEITDGFTLTFEQPNNPEVTCSKETENTFTTKRSNILDLGSVDLRDLVKPAGEGTAANPYEIYSYDNLKYVCEQVTNGNADFTSAYYTQKAIVYAEGRSLGGCIGTNSHPFTGNYDGGNYSIQDLNYTAVSIFNNEDTYALFGNVTNATIKDLNIVNPSFELKDSKSTYTVMSPLVAHAWTNESGATKVLQCTAQCDSCIQIGSSSDSYSELVFGGILAVSHGNTTLNSCTSNISYTFGAEKFKIGGVIGWGTETDFDNVLRICGCRNTGSLTVAADNSNGDIECCCIAGILALTDDSGTVTGNDTQLTMYGCVNAGKITMNMVKSLLGGDYDTEKRIKKLCASGIVGCVDSDGYSGHQPMIKSCINKGALYLTDEWGHCYAGGILGYSYKPEYSDRTWVQYCVATGTVSTNDTIYIKYGTIAGITATTEGAIFEHCFSTATTDNMFYDLYYYLDTDCNHIKAKDLTASSMNGIDANYTSGLVEWTGSGLDIDVKWTGSVE